MKSLGLLLLVGMVGLTSNSYAITVMGDVSCGNWEKERTEEAASILERHASWSSTVNKSWSVGYLSGLASSKQKDFLRITDA